MRGPDKRVAEVRFHVAQLGFVGLGRKVDLDAEEQVVCDRHAVEDRNADRGQFDRRIGRIGLLVFGKGRQGHGHQAGEDQGGQRFHVRSVPQIPYQRLTNA